MQKSLLFSIVSFFQLYSFVINANDTSAVIAGGGIEFKKEPRIVMEKEHLVISENKVEVNYEFKNISSETVEILIAFPIPKYNQFGCQMSETSDMPPSYRDFKTWANSKPVILKKNAFAYLYDTDITSYLKSRGIDPFGNYIDRPGMAKNLRSIDTLDKELAERALGRFRDEDEDLEACGKIEYGWDVSEIYTWTQSFPPNSITKIRHTYTPNVGGNWYTHNKNTGLGDKQYEDDEHIAQRSCIEETLKSSPKTTETSYRVLWVEYILSTAKNWASNINNFTLDIIKPENSILSLCTSENLKKISANTYQLKKSNFIPDKDLNIYFFVKNGPSVTVNPVSAKEKKVMLEKWKSAPVNSKIRELAFENILQFYDLPIEPKELMKEVYGKKYNQSKAALILIGELGDKAKNLQNELIELLKKTVLAKVEAYKKLKGLDKAQKDNSSDNDVFYILRSAIKIDPTNKNLTETIIDLFKYNLPKNVMEELVNGLIQIQTLNTDTTKNSIYKQALLFIKNKDTFQHGLNILGSFGPSAKDDLVEIYSDYKKSNPTDSQKLRFIILRTLYKVTNGSYFNLIESSPVGEKNVVSDADDSLLRAEVKVKVKEKVVEDSCFEMTGTTITDYKCYGQKNVVIPKAIKGIAVTSIRNYLFNVNHELTSVVLPEGIISIGEAAFAKNNLKNIVIPNSVTRIKKWAFWNNKITRVVIPNNAAIVEDEAFDSSVEIVRAK